jgi:glucoamylase
VWRFNHKIRRFLAGQTLRVEALAAARIQWHTGNRETTHEISTEDTRLGVHRVDLPTAKLPAGTTVHFTLFWPEANQWEGTNFAVEINRAEIKTTA